MYIRNIKSKYTFPIVIYCFQPIPDVTATVAEVSGFLNCYFKK